MRNKFIYSCNIKVHVLGFDKLSESIFCLLLDGEAFSLEKVVKMLEDMIVGWWEVRWIWQMRQNFIPQFIQLLKCWLRDVQLGGGVLKNWAHSVDNAGSRCWSFGASHQFAEHISKCNGFAGIQKAVVGQMGSRPPKSDNGLFQFWCKFGFGKCLGAASWSNHWAGGCWFLCAVHFLSYITIQLRNSSLLLCRIREGDISAQQLFWFAVSSWGAHLIDLFQLFSLLQMLNDNRMVDVEFFTTSCVVVRGLPLMNFSIGRSLSPYDSWPLHSSSSRLFYAKLETALQCTLAMYKCIFDVVSCFCCIMTHFQLT